MFRGRKVQVTRLQRERDAAVKERWTAEASGRRETKELCPMDAAESTGARETTMPEERSAAVRRDGEPLTSMAKRRRQTETEADAERPQTDAGERPPSTARERMRRNRHR